MPEDEISQIEQLGKIMDQMKMMKTQMDKNQISDEEWRANAEWMVMQIAQMIHMGEDDSEEDDE